MKSVIHQPFGDIVYAQMRGVLYWPGIDDAFVSDQTAGPCIEDFEMPVQFAGDIIGIEDGNLRCLDQTLPPHHGDICPGNWQD